MNTAQQQLPHDVRMLLDDHLDAVERALAGAGLSRSERRAICDEIEGQACEMLWQRTTRSPGVAQMRAVLAELDPPEAFGDSSVETASADTKLARAVAAAEVAPVATAAEPKLSGLALAAFLVPVVGTAAFIFLGIGPRSEGLAYAYAVFLATISVVLGIGGVRRICRHPDRFWGTSLAVLGMLTLPLLVLNLAVFLLTDEYVARHYGGVRTSIAAYDRQVRALEALETDDGRKVIMLEQLNQTPAPTKAERLRIAREPWGTIAVFVLALGSSALVSLTLIFGLIRWLKPRPIAAPG